MKTQKANEGEKKEFIKWAKSVRLGFYAKANYHTSRPSIRVAMEDICICLDQVIARYEELPLSAMPTQEGMSIKQCRDAIAQKYHFDDWERMFAKRVGMNYSLIFKMDEEWMALYASQSHPLPAKDLPSDEDIQKKITEFANQYFEPEARVSDFQDIATACFEWMRDKALLPREGNEAVELGFDNWCDLNHWRRERNNAGNFMWFRYHEGVIPSGQLGKTTQELYSLFKQIKP